MSDVTTIDRPKWSGTDYGEIERARARRIVSGLSLPMQAALARHGEGPQLYVIRSKNCPTIRALVAKGLLLYDRPNNPRCTTLSALGKPVAAYVMAVEADNLAVGIVP